MKFRMQLTMAVLLTSVFCLLAPPAKAQSLSLTGVASSITATGATITGSLTGTNLFGGVTNAIDVTIFYGHTDAGTITANWANRLDLGSSYTNNTAYTNSFTKLVPNKITYFQVQATDLTGSKLLSASGYFTNSTIAEQENVFREALRQRSFTNIVVGGWTIQHPASNLWWYINGNTTGHLYTVSGP